MGYSSVMSEGLDASDGSAVTAQGASFSGSSFVPDMNLEECIGIVLALEFFANWFQNLAAGPDTPTGDDAVPYNQVSTSLGNRN